MRHFYILMVLTTGMLLQPQLGKAGDQMKVKMTTSMGVIEVELNQDKAPKSVANFLHYVKEGKYNDTIFHRVIPNFMIQGGGFDKDMNKKDTFSSISNEADNGLHNTTGSVAMARTPDPHSASNQFFINTSDNNFLDHSSKTPRGWGYAVFGRVSSGMDVVRKIEEVTTGSRQGMRDVPIKDVVIKKVEIM